MVAFLEEASARPRFDDYENRGALIVWDAVRALPGSIDPAARAQETAAFGLAHTSQVPAALQALYDRSPPGGPGPNPLVFVFSWPSNGRAFPAAEYFSDRDDAQMSGIAMARALVALIDFMTGLYERQDRATIRRARS